MGEFDKFVDGYGTAWRYVRAGFGATVRVRDETDHEDVQLETKEIRAERKASRSLFWPAVVLAFVFHAAVLAALTYGASRLFHSASETLLAVLVCTAYGLSFLATTLQITKGRVERVELHALTVHEELLRVKEAVRALKEEVRGR